MKITSLNIQIKKEKLSKRQNNTKKCGKCSPKQDLLNAPCSFFCFFVYSQKKTVLNICEYWFTYKLALKLPFFEDEKEKCLKTNFPNLQGANDR